MDAFYNPGVHSKYRANNFYQAHQRQSEYNYSNGSRRSGLLFQEYPNQGSEKSKGDSCSIALIVASIFVLVAVLAIAGLAVYMTSLQTESNMLISYSCSAKVLRGDKFAGNLQEKTKRYNTLLETLYKRSILGPALVTSAIERFENDSLTVHFRLTFNKKKLPRNSFSVEKTVRDILLGDILTKRPVFRNIRFDPKNIIVKMISTESNQRIKPKEPVVVKNEPKTSSSSKNTAAQGSFTISKTEADITEKKTGTIQHTRTTSRTTKKPTTTSETTTIKTTTEAITEETTQTTPISKTIVDNLDEAPWVPIPSSNIFVDRTPQFIAPSPTIPPLIKPHPTYTSFTNPGLSFHLKDTEILGISEVKSHPIPVNKISEITESSEPPKFVQVELFEYPDATNKTDGLEEKVIKNISSIFHSLASSLGITPPEEKKIYEVKSDENRTSSRSDTSEEPVVGLGQAEVIESDEESLITQTPKVPLITLLPVKSNSGVQGSLRPRPKLAEDVIENRSFPNNSPFKTLNKILSQTEVVTSVTSEHRVVGFVNFAPEIDPADNQNKKRETKAIGNSGESKNMNILTPEELKMLAEISKLNSNVTKQEEVISTKAISSSFSTNAGFKVLTKTFNKIDVVKDKNSSTTANIKSAECNNFTITCGDGQCLPVTTRCNQLIECNDAVDEKDCDCADYLRSQFLLRKICDGVVDCWDFSDENRCEWCEVGQYVCSNSKVCINRERICDGVRDCPQGDDERQCVTIAPSLKAADEFPYNTEGYLMVRKRGQWGKLCLENFDKTTSLWDISDLGRAVCKALTYQNVTYIKRIRENNNRKAKYYELLLQNQTNSGLIFKEAACNVSEAVRVKCQSLECGARPQAVKHIARIVGGGNAALGAWPWQAALYKEGEFQCGATLLNDRWLLSAGHCFFHSLEEHWVARLGALRRGTTLPSPYEQLRPIVRIIIHPGYVDSGFINDISLLKMEFPIIFSDYVRPICLPSPNTAPSDGALCTVVGWGQLFEAGRIFPDTLQEVQVPVISTIECRKRTVFLPLYSVTENMFCAGFERGGRDACLGDSGGPLMCPETDGRWVLQGVTSNGYGCARANRPGVYTKVANYVNWIRLYTDYEVDEGNRTKKNTCQGHRCPLGECLPKSRLCNSFIECSDGSDEKDCV